MQRRMPFADISKKAHFALFRQRELGHFTIVSRDNEEGRSLGVYK